MKLQLKIAVVAATMALGAAPALALGSSPGNSGTAPGHNKTTSSSTTPSTSTAPTAPTTPPSAFGRLCKEESKKHVAGTPGTPFSKCVTALAHLANGSASSPAKACAKESKKHVAGTPGTPFSKCVKAAAKLLGKH